MRFRVVKVLATGCYLRFATIELPNGKTFTLRINDKLYWELRDLGVPTSQYLRFHKDEKR